ncbi:MAG: beta strand repeat-containing protein [Planctomycetaceae bacterium]
MRRLARPELLERRLALVADVFTVTSLADSGPGSFRQAILDADAAAGFDVIEFAVAGTIRVGRTALPAITEGVRIDGTTAPGFAGSPVVRIDFQNTAGLVVDVGADFTRIASLSLVDAAGPGVTVAGSNVEIWGNFIGVWGNGVTLEPNRGDGVLVQASASGTDIGIDSGERFQLSNLISGNLGNGITIDGAVNTLVVANQIGTDASGRLPLGNRGHGIRITNGASGNLVGGEATGGNNPTQGTFVRPPQGNLISANHGCGVMIDGGATVNSLSGNFIGTTASGNAALGNWRDGVAIVGANGNRLVGTTAFLDPFVFYNVLSGNWGNGLRITSSNDTVVHANFFGLGANDATRVPNGGDGLLVNGTSQRTDAGGEIPLGNVMSGNLRHGIEVSDTAGGLLSFNNFVGQVAFGGAAPNGLSGILVTSSNPGFTLSDSSTWNRIRTSLVGGNFGSGIEFLGNARGAEVTDTAVGTNYAINGALPNLGHGIVVGGNASQIAIGGFQPSIERLDGGFGVHVGGNLGFGIVFRGRAHDCFVFNSRVGLGVGATIETAARLPNGAGGVWLGPGTSNISIGGPLVAPPGKRYANEIVGNRGNGLTVLGSSNLALLGCTISDNAGSGVVLTGTAGAMVGEPNAANTIARNRAFGLYAVGRLDGTMVRSSTIAQNGWSGVRLVAARGITVGGDGPSEANAITGNRFWGLLASGWCRGSALAANSVAGNTPGNVNTRAAFGLVTPFA